ncbi:MAG: sigma-70 family RNA polymerase sigma factor [Pseudomonadota bacterium]
MLSDPQRDALLAEIERLRRFCISLTGTTADGDDLLQSTVERLLQKGVPRDAHVIKWAYKVCKNAWIDEIRARDVRQRYPKMAQDDTGMPSAEQTASKQRELEIVNEALSQLPTDQRLALMLVAIDGKSYAEAAEIMDVPVGTIMSRIARARRSLAANEKLIKDD